MVSKPLAFGLLLGSCVVAAGGGAYIATLQNGRSTSTASTPLSAPVAAPAPQDVVSAQGSPSTSAVPSSGQSLETAESPAAERPSDIAPRVAPVKKPAPKTDARTTNNESPAVVPRPGDAPTTVQGVTPVPPTLPPAGDPGSNPQRPWPGPPTPSTGQVPPLSGGADPARGDPEPLNDNVKLWEELVIPTESVLGLQLDSALNTDQAQVEDRVDARLTRDVRVNGRVAIPSGSHVVGSVVLVERGGKLKERARIGIRFHTVHLADGSRLQISTDTLLRESESPANKASAKIGGAAIGGAIIGAIIGGGKGAAIGSGIGAAGGTAAAMSSDRMRVVLPAGTTVSVRTQAPIRVMVEK